VLVRTWRAVGPTTGAQLDGSDGLVFVGPKGGALSSGNFGADVWRPVIRSVGLSGFTFMGLRECPPR
jgi:hypothetical protein